MRVMEFYMKILSGTLTVLRSFMRRQEADAALCLRNSVNVDIRGLKVSGVDGERPDRDERMVFEI